MTTKTITIRDYQNPFTLTVGDKAVVQTAHRSLGRTPPPQREVVEVTRILGSAKAPYVEVKYKDGKVELFVEGGHRRGHERYNDYLRLVPFVSDEHEVEHAKAVAQFKRIESTAYEMTIAFDRRQAYNILHNHPELLADFEALLEKIKRVAGEED